MDEKYLRSRARTQALLSVLVLGGVIVAQVIAVLFVFVLRIPDDSLWAAILPQLFSAVWAVVGVVMLGGGRLAIPRAREIAHAFRFSWLCIAVAVALLVYQAGSYVAEGTEVDPLWPIKVAECAVLCLMVGIHEEFVFRGIIFQSLLGLVGGTHKGLVGAVIVSSLIFGVMHIDISSDLISPTTCLQAVLKVIQTGMFGVLMCAVTLHRRSLVGASLVHGLDDFLLMVVSIGMFREPFETEYTTDGEDALSTIILYLIVIALYLPFTIKSLREIRRRGYVYRGEFMEREIAHARELEVRRRQEEFARAQAAAQAEAARWAQGPVQMQAHVPLAQMQGQVPGQPAWGGQGQPQQAWAGQDGPQPWAGQGQPQQAWAGQDQAQQKWTGQGQAQAHVPVGPYGPVRVQSVPLAQVPAHVPSPAPGQAQGSSYPTPPMPSDGVGKPPVPKGLG